MSVDRVSSMELISAFSLTADAQQSGNLYHGWRVALVAYAMGAELPPDERVDLFLAGLMHDVWCIGSLRHITACPQMAQQLADQQIKNHPSRGASIMRSIPGLRGAAEIVEAHHEWWDGTGYPYGIRGGDIP